MVLLQKLSAAAPYKADSLSFAGATIKISQKGEYAPGTTNRVVSIMGNQEAAAFAHTLVQAKLSHSS